MSGRSGGGGGALGAAAPIPNADELRIMTLSHEIETLLREGKVPEAEQRMPELEQLGQGKSRGLVEVVTRTQEMLARVKRGEPADPNAKPDPTTEPARPTTESPRG